MKRSHRQVAVILNADVVDVGFAGELLTVKTGFARNFLLAKDFAELATPQRVKQREAELGKAAERRQTEVAKLEELAATIAAEPIKLSLNTGPGGRVFGSLTAADITEAVKKQRKITLDPKQLTGALPIKMVGATSVSAKLGVGVTAEVPLEIAGKPVKKSGDDDGETAGFAKDDKGEAPETPKETESPAEELSPESAETETETEAVPTPS